MARSDTTLEGRDLVNLDYVRYEKLHDVAKVTVDRPDVLNAISRKVPNICRVAISNGYICWTISIRNPR